jgi:hypothetical protein
MREPQPSGRLRVPARRHLEEGRRRQRTSSGSSSRASSPWSTSRRGRANQLARAEEWLEHADQHLTYPGYTGAWLYSGDAFFEEHGLMPIADSKRHTDSQEWPGIGTCDSSIYEGDLKGLRAAVGG